jgi:hypothetical protein
MPLSMGILRALRTTALNLLRPPYLVLFALSIAFFFRRLGAYNTTVTFEISSGEFLTCAILKLRIFDRMSLNHPNDVIFGRDRLNLYSIGLEGNPDAAVRLPTT